MNTLQLCETLDFAFRGEEISHAWICNQQRILINMPAIAEDPLPGDLRGRIT